MSAPSISQNSNPIPIVTEQEVAAASVSIVSAAASGDAYPVDPNMDKSLSDEELLKDAEESDNSV